MNRYLFLTAIFFSQLCLQNISISAQAKKLEGTNIEFTLPNEKWVLTISDKSGRGAVYAYQREPLAGDDSKPSISFILEELPEKKRVSQYASEKMKLAKITEVRYYEMNERKKFGLVNGMLSKGYAGGDSVYFGSAVNGLKAVMILCSAKGKSFAKYDPEFLSLLASLTYTFAAAKEADNTTGVSKSKTGETEKGSINLCSYFPVKNGLKFTYKRNNMMGEQTITEAYTTVKDKVLKSGKAIKGYRISTADENRNNTIIYYYCEGGSVKMYAEMPEYNTQLTGYVEDYSILPSDYNKPDYKKTPIWETEKVGSGKFLSFTELKDGNAGTAWTDVQVVNGNPVIITSTIEETGLTMTVQGKTYSPVIHVNRSVSVKVFGEVQNLNTQDIYYANGIGKIKVIEQGQALLMGSYTTTQELISHNLPAQTNNNKKTEEIKPTGKTSSQKMGAAAIEAICDKWCGSYKLVEKNGQAVGDFPYGEYLHLETEGDAVSMILQKKSGKLYETGKETGLEWTVWMENNQQVIYIRTASETKGKPLSSTSLPHKKIVYDNKVYEYVSREVQYY